MSITKTEQVRCDCGAPNRVTVVDSLNAGRHPHLRKLVLDRALHVFVCAACKDSFCVAKELFYFDFERRQMLGVFLPEDRPRERECSEHLVELFDTYLRQQAPELIRAASSDFLVRACFSYEELREKLVIDEAGMSDLSIEVIKRNILARPDLRAAQIATLRLDEVTARELRFRPEWLDDRPRDLTEVLVYQRALYDRMHDHHDVLRAQYPNIASGPHVDLLRMLEWPSHG